MTDDNPTRINLCWTIINILKFELFKIIKYRGFKWNLLKNF
jgi:hypothetical protein